MGRLIICADDFGMSEGVSRTIVELALAGKLNAISCMAASKRWPQDAQLLKCLPSRVALGLHLVLSGEPPLTRLPRLAPNGRLPNVRALEKRARLTRLPLEEVQQEVASQFSHFGEVVGRPPDFVDAHQHVHFLPGVRRIVIEETGKRAPAAWIRTCEDKAQRLARRPFALKAMLNAVQAAGFRNAARKAGLKCNDGFAGLYDFSSDYEALFPCFIKAPGELHLVICHPGEGMEDPDDPIAVARGKEAAALRHAPVAELAANQGLSY